MASSGESNFWIERFIEHCRSVVLCDRAAAGLREAVGANTRWTCNYNDIIAEFDPSRQQITVTHELSEISDPPASATSVTDFLHMLSNRRASLLAS
jgi:hypothetical protein